MHLAFIQYDPLFLPRRSQARRDCRRLRLGKFVRLSSKAPNTLTLLQVDGKLWTEARDALAGDVESSCLKGGGPYTLFTALTVLNTKLIFEYVAGSRSLSKEPFLDRMK